MVLDQVRKKKSKPKIIALSFFSGAMGLDLGFKKAGIDPLLVCEFDNSCRETIIKNIPDIGLIGDIWGYEKADIFEYAGLEKNDKVDIMLGGPPCQAFSTAGSRKSFDDKRGNVFLRFIDLILEISPKYAVIENVRGLLSASIKHVPYEEKNNSQFQNELTQPGGALLHILNILEQGGYKVSFNLYNAANFGVPQSRERVIMICHKGSDKVPYLTPTHSNDEVYGLKPWKTLREALDGLDPSKQTYNQFPANRLKFYKHLKAGQYWKHLPNNLIKEALGNSINLPGGKTGFLRRLDWNKPSCTLVTSPTMPATDICHPDEDRPLSVQEYKRIQQFPDDWIFAGSITNQYKQIGNAVPVGLGFAVAQTIKNHMTNKQSLIPDNFRFSRYHFTDDKSWIIKNFPSQMNLF